MSIHITPTVKDAFEFFQKLMNEGKGDFPMYSEYSRVYQMHEKIADECCDGSQMEMEPGTPFLEIDLDY